MYSCSLNPVSPSYTEYLVQTITYHNMVGIDLISEINIFCYFDEYSYFY